jgi:hypothetical protein
MAVRLQAEVVVRDKGVWCLALTFRSGPLARAARERLSMKLVKPLFKNVFTPPDESSDERCWPGGSFHRKVYGHATSQK